MENRIKVPIAGDRVTDILYDNAIPKEEVLHYFDELCERHPNREISEVIMRISEEDGFIDLEFYYGDRVPFDRIRRITGYLTGTLDRFNNAKKAEEHDRVKHSF